MTELTVGQGQPYASIAAAVAASNTGDTITVKAGSYNNDFVTITHDLTLKADGGTVRMTATQQPPNGKAMIDEGGAGVHVAITGFDISGVSVPDGNGAAIRYEGGELTLQGVNLHDNQEGLLGADDPAGSITVRDSVVADNGTGSGFVHGLYVGHVANLTVQDSQVTGTKVGHEIKSRAANNVITGNLIGDGPAGNSSYEIDLPNGGAATIANNVIQKGAAASNPNVISFGEEGDVQPGSRLTVTNNTIVNDSTGHATTAVANYTDAVATIDANRLFGLPRTFTGAANEAGTILLGARPAADAKPTAGGPNQGTAPTGTPGNTGETSPPATGTIPSGTADGTTPDPVTTPATPEQTTPPPVAQQPPPAAPPTTGTPPQPPAGNAHAGSPTAADVARDFDEAHRLFDLQFDRDPKSLSLASFSHWHDDPGSVPAGVGSFWAAAAQLANDARALYGHHQTG